MCQNSTIKIIHNQESVYILQKHCYFYMFVTLFRWSNKKEN